MKKIKQNCQIKQNLDYMKKKNLIIILSMRLISKNYTVKN